MENLPLSDVPKKAADKRRDRPEIALDSEDARKKAAFKVSLDKAKKLSILLRARTGDAGWELGPGIAVLKELGLVIKQLPELAKHLTAVEDIDDAKVSMGRAHRTIDNLKSSVATEEFGAEIDRIVPEPRELAVTDSARKMWALRQANDLAPNIAPMARNANRTAPANSGPQE